MRSKKKLRFWRQAVIKGFTFFCALTNGLQEMRLRQPTGKVRSDAHRENEKSIRDGYSGFQSEGGMGMSHSLVDFRKNSEEYSTLALSLCGAPSVQTDSTYPNRLSRTNSSGLWSRNNLRIARDRASSYAPNENTNTNSKRR
jgi:hypothetical protein